MFLMNLNYLLLVNTPEKAAVWQSDTLSSSLNTFQNGFLCIRETAIPISSLKWETILLIKQESHRDFSCDMELCGSFTYFDTD